MRYARAPVPERGELLEIVHVDDGRRRSHGLYRERVAIEVAADDLSAYAAHAA